MSYFLAVTLYDVVHFHAATNEQRNSIYLCIRLRIFSYAHHSHAAGKRQWKPTQRIHAHSLPANQWGRQHSEWWTQFNHRRWNIANKVGNPDNGCSHCSQAKTEIRLHRIHALSYAVNCLKKWLAYSLSQRKSQHAENAPKQRSRRMSNTELRGLT